MFRRAWERLSRRWRPAPCAVCGAPAVGFRSEMVGRLPTKDKDGKPITKMYVRGAEWRCRKCLGDGS
jgi:hypothetical protein